MTTLREAAARQFGFNPSEKRGWGGKWIHAGDVARSLVGKEGDEGARRLDAHQRASDDKHIEHPNRLDRLAERMGRRADVKMDSKIVRDRQEAQAKSRTEGAILGHTYKHLGLEGKTEKQVFEMWKSGKLQKRGITLKQLPQGVRDRASKWSGGSVDYGKL